MTWQNWLIIYLQNAITSLNILDYKRYMIAISYILVAEELKCRNHFLCVCQWGWRLMKKIKKNGQLNFIIYYPVLILCLPHRHCLIQERFIRNYLVAI